jgi:hypothetical protein
VTDAQSPEAGLGLDHFLERTLRAQPSAADWGLAAQLLMESTQSLGLPRSENIAFDPRLRDPLERLRRSELAKSWIFGRQGPPRLAEISQAAVHLLETERLDDNIERWTGHRPSPQSRRIVVYHGQRGERRSLLVLDPSLPPHADAVVLPSELVADVVRDMPQEAAYRALSRLDESLHPEFTAELLAIARPRVVYAPAPPMEFVCVPQPSWRADCGLETSTVGALVRDAAGQRGVTVCYHGSGPVGTGVKLSEGASQIDGQVAQASPVMDTCFVPISDNWRPAGLAARLGVLDRRAPGASELHRFEGASSGLKATRIVGADMGVPTPTPGRQLCVHTTPDLSYGDSGAALINQDERLVGFAFQRTPYGSPSPMSFASWIWAASALDDLSLTLAET